MKDESAFPLLVTKTQEEESVHRAHGLTKLEYAAIEAMKGFLLSTNPDYRFFNANEMSRAAINQAKALLAELENEQAIIAGVDDGTD